MYVPTHFAMAPAALRALLGGHGAGELITATPRGLVATLLPFVHDEAAGTHGALLGHLARNNDHWQLPVHGEALVVLRGPDGYVSPQSYASKAEHGRVVPTWDYVTAHVYGELVVHDDPAWTGELVDRLTRHHEAARTEPWQVGDAPEHWIAGQLRAIVGVEVQITRVEAKAKLSQNRPAADVDGVVRDTRAAGLTALADAVEATRPTARPPERLPGAARGALAPRTTISHEVGLELARLTGLVLVEPDLDTPRVAVSPELRRGRCRRGARGRRRCGRRAPAGRRGRRRRSGR